MNIYAGLSLLVSYVFLLLGTYIYQKDSKEELNRVFMVFCAVLGYLAFIEFGYRQAEDFNTAYIWLKAASVWPFTIAISLHLVLIYTRKVTLLRKRIIYFLIYAPAFFFFLLDLTTDQLSGGYRREYWGWTYNIPENRLLYNINIAWSILLVVLFVSLLLLYWYKAEEPVEKQRATYVSVGVCVTAIIGIATEVALPMINIRIPELAIASLAAGIGFVVYGLWKYELFILSPTAAAEDIVVSMSNLLFLVKEDGTISLANHAALHLLGYSENELVGQPFRRVVAEHEWEKTEEYPLEREGMSNEEILFKTKDGRMIPVLLSISVIRKDKRDLGMVCVGSDLTDRKQVEEAHKKELLLKEIHHRVKNNMQIISSLLSLQSQYIRNEMYREMLKESQNRIKSMALIHEKLYQSRDLENIDSKEYIMDMVNKLVRSYGATYIAVTVEVEDVSLGVDIAVPCGLIINELASNCLKHAFPDGKGEITVVLRSVDGTIELTVADNGVGIPEDIDFRNAETFGLRLVTMLVEDQLCGTIRLARRKGTEFYITFKETK
ncbi:MAG: PAS domain S-box protein [Theionarchaea archaeon]|nr:MAG: hypothetical protein AYK19_16485 [Theionarchaea archaeon DG-70-1]MBU7030191.1 PAS domain S-box protein [Theionarchaea archaeon]